MKWYFLSKSVVIACVITITLIVIFSNYSNSNAQDGGTFSNYSVPVSMISAQINHTCALKITGGVKCWGYNGSGQLGDGTNIERHKPVDVFGLTSGVKSIATGDDFACALLSSGVVKCWGYNNFGQLGNGSFETAFKPVEVEGLGGNVKGIGAGENHCCAITSSGGVKCWGNNWAGQLGNNSTNNHGEALP